MRNVMNMNVCYDHRSADGSDGKYMMQTLEKVFKNPRDYTK